MPDVDGACEVMEGAMQGMEMLLRGGEIDQLMNDLEDRVSC